ncbi:MAG: hypothetical protein ACRCY7_07830 [Cetobacterium sp.]|uniref:hypothetical protein n=1 Tax=Cetobacterium sp. TaxID=2071632 RepID=UPI003F2A7106
MLATTGVILTKAGALMISRALELIKPIEFTHMKIGTGDINSLSEARELNDLVSTHSTINMSTIVRSGDLVRVRGSFTNAEFISEQTIKEIGVFAKIGTEQPLLFGYVNDGQGEIIPPGNSGNVVSRVRDLYLGITGEAQVAITVDKSLVYATIEDLEEGLNKKEDKFDKNSGFNKSKSDSTNLEDSNTLATSKAVSTAMKKATEAYDSAGGKEAAFNKNTAFNKNFGVSSGEVLEGAKLAEILGVTYGGILNNSNAKTAGIAYYCTTNKKIYKCTANTSLNYADASYFMELSNNDLLGKLNNLDKQEAITITPNSIFSISSTSIRAVKIGRIVYLYIHDISIKTGDISKNTAIFTAPQGFKPIETVEATTSNHIHLANIDRASIGSDGIFRIIGGGNGYIPIGQHSLFMVYPTN